MITLGFNAAVEEEDSCTEKGISIKARQMKRGLMDRTG
jgi:hypothetical protein